MFKSLLESLKSKPKNKFSLENLQFLHVQLTRNPVVTEANKDHIIETLRQLAEVLIWGDQHDPQFFDFFLEHNLFSNFLLILEQKTHKQVKLQLIQTLSILIENIQDQNSLYYLFSNNHMNELINHKWDFSDDELMAYYISLLKTLSLKLNPFTIQFFFNAMENDFPLYTEAIKFFNHKDSMIRIAVRTLTLNVFKVEDEAMRTYILDKTAAPYFSNIVWYIRDQCTTLDNHASNASHKHRAKLEDFVDELLDYFYYLHDIFNLGINELNEVLSDHLLKCLLLPQFVGSLLPGELELEDQLSPLLAVFLLAQVFHIFSYKPLVNSITAALIHPNPTSYSYSTVKTPLSPTIVSRMPTKRYSLSDLQELEEEHLRAKQSAVQRQLKHDELNLTHCNQGNRYFSALISFIQTEDRMALAVMSLLFALVKNPAMDSKLLEASGLLPYRLFRSKQLLAVLIAENEKREDSTDSAKLGHGRSLSLNGLGRPVWNLGQDVENKPNPESDFNQLEVEIGDDPELPSTPSIDSIGDEEEAKMVEINDSIGDPVSSVNKFMNEILLLLLRSQECRLITLQMAILLLKEMVYCLDSLPNLSEEHLKTVEDAYSDSIHSVQSCLKGSLSDIFLELFEQELRRYKQMTFDSLMVDSSSFLLPVSATPMSGIGLSKRLPSGEAERTQKAIQTFLVLRELRYTTLKKKDDKLPFREEPLPSYKVKDILTLENRQAMVCTMTAASKRRQLRFLIIESGVLIIGEPDPRGFVKNGKQQSTPTTTTTCIVSSSIPLQNIELEVDKADECALHLTSHVTTSQFAFIFEDSMQCQSCQQRLEKAKNMVRANKMRQINAMLEE